MHRRSLRLALGVLVAATGLIIAGAAGGVAQKANAGSVVFGAEQEPPCLNGFLEGCNNTWTSWTAGIALPRLYIVNPRLVLVPDMGTATIVKKKPFTLKVSIKPKAKWSDGRQVSVDD